MAYELVGAYNLSRIYPQEVAYAWSRVQGWAIPDGNARFCCQLGNFACHSRPQKVPSECALEELCIPRYEYIFRSMTAAHQ